MPFPSPHLYFNISGAIRGTEEWSIGLRILANGFDGDEGDQIARLTSVRTAFESWWSTQNVISSACTVRTLKLNRVGTDGKYLYDYTIRHDYATPLTAPASSTHPNQISLVATLETGFTRGLAARGRLFLPVPPMPVGTDGRLSQANAAGAATTVANLVSALNGVASIDDVVVMSQVNAGAVRPVTGVSIGRVLDTMRSRRTSLDEGRELAAVTASS